MKTIIITGVGRGIGLATAKKFLAEGWRVIATYHATPLDLQHEQLTAVQLDVASPENIAVAVAEISSRAPMIDALVNSAGILLDAKVVGIDLELTRRMMEVNVYGLIDLTERLLPHLAADGHIVNVDSQYGAFSYPIDVDNSNGYRITKAALNMYTRILADRLRGQGRIVSSLDPGWVQTDMGYSVATDDEQPDRTPEDAANDIYQLVMTVTEAGCFWRFGQKREW